MPPFPSFYLSPFNMLYDFIFANIIFPSSNYRNFCLSAHSTSCLEAGKYSIYEPQRIDRNLIKSMQYLNSWGNGCKRTGICNQRWNRECPDFTLFFPPLGLIFTSHFPHLPKYTDKYTLIFLFFLLFRSLFHIIISEYHITSGNCLWYQSAYSCHIHADPCIGPNILTASSSYAPVLLIYNKDVFVY